MTLKASIEIAINFDRIVAKRLMRQGYIRYHIGLSYVDPKTGGKVN